MFAYKAYVKRQDVRRNAGERVETLSILNHWWNWNYLKNREVCDGGAPEGTECPSEEAGTVDPPAHEGG